MRVRAAATFRASDNARSYPPGPISSCQIAGTLGCAKGLGDNLKNTGVSGMWLRR